MAGSSRVTHPSATFLFKISSEDSILKILVQLACVMHAASVNPEPGSNSHRNSREPIQALLFAEIIKLKVIQVFNLEGSRFSLLES